LICWQKSSGCGVAEIANTLKQFAGKENVLLSAKNLRGDLTRRCGIQMDRANAKNGRRQTMAEMTASEAREILLNLSWAVGAERRSQIAALVEQQAQEIERLNKSLQFEQNYLSRVGTHAEGCYKWGPGHWDCAMQEIAQRDRMIEKACKRLSMTNMSIRTEKQWLAWLENEAEGVE